MILYANTVQTKASEYQTQSKQCCIEAHYFEGIAMSVKVKPLTHLQFHEVKSVQV